MNSNFDVNQFLKTTLVVFVSVVFMVTNSQATQENNYNKTVKKLSYLVVKLSADLSGINIHLLGLGYSDGVRVENEIRRIGGYSDLIKMNANKMETCVKSLDIFEILNSLKEFERNLISLRVGLYENLVKNKKINAEADKAINQIGLYFENQEPLLSDFLYQSDSELKRIDLSGAGCNTATL